MNIRLIAAHFRTYRHHLVVFATALAARLTHIIVLAQTKPFYGELLVDARAYDQWGQQIARGDVLGSGIFYQDPLYPYFLGLIYAVFGHSLIIVLVLQSLIGAGSALLVFLIGSRIGGRPVGLIAGLLVALHAPLIFYEGLIMKEGLAIFFILLALYGLTMARETGSFRATALAGVALGFASLVRGNIFLFLPFVIVWLFVEKLPVIKHGLLLLAGMFIVLAPVAVRNAAVGGEVVLTTAQAGANFYWGNNETSDGTLLTAPPFVRSRPPYERTDFADEAMKEAGRPLSDTEISRFWFRKGMEFVVRHPVRYLRLQFTKLRLLLNDEEVSDNYQYYFYRRYSPVTCCSPLGFGFIASFCFVGVFATRHRLREHLLLYLFILSYSLSLLLFTVVTRYRLPLVPVLAIFAAAGLQALWHDLRGRKLAPLGGALAVIVVAAPLIWMPVPWLAEFNRAAVLEREGFEAISGRDYQTAESRYRELVSRSSGTSFSGHFGLGMVRYKSRQYAEAIQEFNAALSATPDSGLAYNLMGLSYIQLGEFDRAITALDRSVALEPALASSYLGLSVAYKEKKRDAEAQRYMERFMRSEGR